MELLWFLLLFCILGVARCIGMSIAALLEVTE